MSAQKFPSRLFAVERHASFQSNFTPIVEIIAHHKPWKSAYGETKEYLSIDEHKSLLAEKDKRIEELEAVVGDSIYKEPEPEELTCFTCVERESCQFSGDDYNTDGDCLAEK